MPDSSAIKKRGIRALKLFHYLLTILLLLTAAVWFFEDYLHPAIPVQPRLYLQKELPKGYYLYETETLTKQGVPQYHYYLTHQTQNNIKLDLTCLNQKPVKESCVSWHNPKSDLFCSSPFLVADRSDAKISFLEEDKEGEYPHFSIKYSGKIFKFENIYRGCSPTRPLFDIEPSFSKKMISPIKE